MKASSKLNGCMRLSFFLGALLCIASSNIHAKYSWFEIAKNEELSVSISTKYIKKSPNFAAMWVRSEYYKKQLIGSKEYNLEDSFQYIDCRNNSFAYKSVYFFMNDNIVYSDEIPENDMEYKSAPPNSYAEKIIELACSAPVNKKDQPLP